MNTNQIGNLGELKIIEVCLKNNIQVFLPFGDGNIADMILVVNGKCLKAQVKSTMSGAEDGILTFSTSSSQSTRTNGRHYYTKEEIDIFLFYSYVYDEIYVMSIDEAPKNSVVLRHNKPKVIYHTMRFTEDYSFDKIFNCGAMV